MTVSSTWGLLETEVQDCWVSGGSYCSLCQILGDLVQIASQLTIEIQGAVKS